MIEPRVIQSHLKARLRRESSLLNHNVKTMSSKEYRARSIFVRLCMQTGVWKTGNILFRHPWLSIDSSDELNASTACEYPHVDITRYDLGHLSDNDLTALLAHEVGHIVCQRQHSDEFNVRCFGVMFSVIPMVLLLKLTVATLNAWWGAFLTPVIMIVSAIVCARLIPMYAIRKDEYHADRVGMSVIGRAKMVHLMETCVRHEAHEHNDIVQCVRDTWTCPWACLRCLALLLMFDIKQRLDDINLSSHPTYRERIKHLDKASKRVIQ